MSKARTKPRLVLSAEQEEAVSMAVSEFAPGHSFLIEGPAGSGKTTVIEEIVRRLMKRRLSVTTGAPTHKAVGVLRRKLDAADLVHIPCRTIPAIMNLRPRQYADRQVFTRQKYAKPFEDSCLIPDECSMLGEDILENHLRKYLPKAYVIYTGDEAQIPPIGEKRSRTFDLKNKYTLQTVRRQAEGNPVLAAALAVRQQQGTGYLDWSWAVQRDERPFGIFKPDAGKLRLWAEKAFTSPEFEADSDTFRYIAWRRVRVDEINRAIRLARYGEQAANAAPFCAGEMLTFLEPMIKDETPVFMTGDDAKVLAIQQGEYVQEFPRRGDVSAWTAFLPSWEIKLLSRLGEQITVHMSRSEEMYKSILDQLGEEAKEHGERWEDYQLFKDSIARVRAIYAMTCHGAQGSTFKHVFLDAGDIANAAKKMTVLECQKILYTGLTRPTHSVILRGR